MVRITVATFALACCLADPGAAGELCLVPSEANGFNASVDCVNLLMYPNDYIGFGSGSDRPCWTEWLCTIRGNVGWTISRSASDPLENTSGWGIGIAELYLWYYCSSFQHGLTSAEFDLAGSIMVLGFKPMNGFVNAGDATHLLLSVGGCPRGPVVAGAIQVSDPTPVDATTWGRIKSTYR